MSEATGISIFGEVLFDTFPDGTAVLGGAPFNVAWNMTAFQVDPKIITAVGRDASGQTIQDRMNSWQMNCDHLALFPPVTCEKTGTERVRGKNTVVFASHLNTE